MFSSPRAFYETLKTHRETVERGGSQHSQKDGALTRILTRAEDEFGTDEEVEEAQRDALLAASRRTPPLTPQQQVVLDRMMNAAEHAADQTDAKTATLIKWLGDIVRPGGAWSDERVIIFTEYRETQKYLVDQLTAAGLAQGDRLRTLWRPG